MNNTSPPPSDDEISWLPADDPSAAAELLDTLMDEHADRIADRVLARLGGPLDASNLSAYLNDETCLRHPTTIRYTTEGLEPHQFGEPSLNGSGSSVRSEIRIHPDFEFANDLLPLFVAYLSPVVNYGPLVSSTLCESYGAKITGMDADAFYERLCTAIDTRA